MMHDGPFTLGFALNDFTSYAVFPRFYFRL
jgi:hypothetical protein